MEDVIQQMTVLLVFVILADEDAEVVEVEDDEVVEVEVDDEVD